MKKSFFKSVFTEQSLQEDLIAIIDKTSNKKFSYKKLYEEVLIMSNLIKHEIKKYHKEPVSGIVAINTHKNSKFLIAQLACSTLGLAFLPLDNKQKQRNSEILNEIKPLVIIDDDSILAFPSFNTIDEDCEYLIYSSGSTGKPKGILMKGEPAIHIVSQQAQLIGIKPKDKYLWLLSPAFDASLSDIYSTLTSMGTLVIPNFDTHEIKKLCKTIEEDSINFLDLPPSMFSLFYKNINKFNSTSIKAIVFGGETAPETITQQLSKQFNLFLAYGPTETTICSSMKKIDSNTKSSDIGLPLHGVSYHIVDNELLISGNVISLGYYNNEVLNNSKFININNKLWFKTGDCVLYNDNSYHYKGRVDRQFKFHSQLISPEEVEMKALSFGATLCHVAFDGKIHLYYQGKLNIDALKSSLATYMVPHFFYDINHIKDISQLLNSNHKIDHKLFLNKIDK